MLENEIRRNFRKFENPQFKEAVASVPGSTWFVFPTENISLPCFLHDLLLPGTRVTYAAQQTAELILRLDRLYIRQGFRKQYDIPPPTDETTANEIPEVSHQAQV